ncbi:MAG: endolytic transglycosylase MltG [Nitrospinota bacterium]|nr:endolytic transglycosylase MltG [Nitrospinota bacterium]
MKKSLAAIVILVLSAGAIFALFEVAVTRPGAGAGDVMFEARKGESTRSVARNLERQGVVPSALLFELEMRGCNRGQSVKAGEYLIPLDYSTRQVAELLLSARTWARPVTIREGLTVRETALEMEKAGIMSASDFNEAARGMAERMRADGFPGGTLEGYLFPDTYNFSKSITPMAAVVVMVDTFRKKAAETLPMEVVEDPVALHRLVTMASIIEKETGAGFERPLISAVFHNRLKRGMLLQSDPTVIYSLPSFDGNIRKKDLSYDSPYNTYRYRGLPPGPIANPGLESLAAAWRPADSDYIYFVSKNNGEHYFSETLAEHNRAVITFQIRRGRK